MYLLLICTWIHCSLLMLFAEMERSRHVNIRRDLKHCTNKLADGCLEAVLRGWNLSEICVDGCGGVKSAMS